MIIYTEQAHKILRGEINQVIEFLNFLEKPNKASEYLIKAFENYEEGK